MINLGVSPREEQSLLLTLTFSENGTAYTPLTAVWSLSDSSGDIINSRSDVSLSVASTIYLRLQGDDLALLDADTKRVLTVTWIYNSVNWGNNTKGGEEIIFAITPLVNVP